MYQFVVEYSIQSFYVYIILYIIIISLSKLHMLVLRTRFTGAFQGGHAAQGSSGSKAPEHGGKSSGGETPGHGGKGRWTKAEGDEWKGPQKRVSFAQEMESHVEFTKDEVLEGSLEVHLPTVGSLVMFLDCLLSAAQEADPFMPGLKTRVQDLLADMSSGWLGFSDSLAVLDRAGANSSHFYLAVCVVCHPWLTEVLPTSLPILLAQALPFLGRVRLHVLLPQGAAGAMGWVLANCEFAVRLQLLRVYVTDTGKAMHAPWHDAVWRNALAKAALKDGATVLHKMEAEHVHDGDWLSLLMQFPYSLRPASEGGQTLEPYSWRPASEGGQTPEPYSWRLASKGGQTHEDTNVLAVVMQDSAGEHTAAITVVSWLWGGIGGWDEECVLSYFDDIFSRIKAIGKVGFLVDQDAAGVFLGGETPEELWQAMAKHFPSAYAGKDEAEIRAWIRSRCEKKMAAGNVVWDAIKQSEWFAPRISAKPGFLEFLESDFMRDDDEEPPMADWGGRNRIAGDG